MKGITLNIDLEQNKDLEQEVTEAIRAYAKRVSREYAQKEVEAEVSRIIDKRIEAYVRTRDCASKICEAVNDVFIENVKQNGSVTEMVNRRMDSYIGTSQETAQRCVERVVKEYLDARFSDVLTKFICEAVKDSFLKGQNNG